MMQKKKKTINESRRWQTPPDDMMEQILQRLSLWDRIQLRMVCQSWRSLSMRRDIRSSPNEMPWLLLLPRPPSPYVNRFCNYDYKQFFSLSDDKVHKLRLPRAFGAGWVHGSSKGWLIMIKGTYSKMVLLNPISGALQKLPSCTGVFPRFGALRELEGVNLTPQAMDNFCTAVVLSTSDIYSESCMVAAIFRNRILAVCRPGEKRWSKVLEFEDSADAPSLWEILFSSSGNKLYALVCRGEIDDLDVAAQAKMFDSRVEVKFVYVRVPPPIQTTSRWAWKSRLIESTTKNEVLLIYQILSADKREMIKILVYKLDDEKNDFVEVKNLGNHVIFFAEFGSLCLASAAFGGNCICFSTVERSSGVFYVSSGRIELVGNSLALSGKFGSCWFTPSL